MTSNNPYQAPITVAVKPQEKKTLSRGPYGGIGRLTYFLASLGFGIVNNIIQYVGILNNIDVLVIASVVLGLIVGITLVVLRLQNLGHSAWWILAFIVPILNLLVALRCIAGPEGYADHKQLDTAGKVIIGVILGFFFLLMIPMLVLMFTS